MNATHSTPTISQNQTANLPNDQAAAGTEITLLKQSQAGALWGWAFVHGPTREAYRRSTGEDVGPAIDRYREWVEENLVGCLDEVDRGSVRGAG